MKNLLMFLGLLLVWNSPVWAAKQKVILSVPAMVCGACPITVKLALKKVDGVSRVETNAKHRLALVIFDDEKTNVNQLSKATEDAGYPSTIAALKK